MLQKKHWIDERPQTINDRVFYGHWEGDTVRGYQHSGYLVTLVERKSGYILVGHISQPSKEQFRQCVEQLLFAATEASQTKSSPRQWY